MSPILLLFFFSFLPFIGRRRMRKTTPAEGAALCLPLRTWKERERFQKAHLFLQIYIMYKIQYLPTLVFYHFIFFLARPWQKAIVLSLPTWSPLIDHWQWWEKDLRWVFSDGGREKTGGKQFLLPRPPPIQRSRLFSLWFLFLFFFRGKGKGIEEEGKLLCLGILFLLPPSYFPYRKRLRSWGQIFFFPLGLETSSVFFLVLLPPKRDGSRVTKSTRTQMLQIPENAESTD